MAAERKTPEHLLVNYEYPSLWDDIEECFFFHPEYWEKYNQNGIHWIFRCKNRVNDQYFLLPKNIDQTKPNNIKGLVIFSRKDDKESFLACRFKGVYLSEFPQLLLEHWTGGFYEGKNSISLINITKGGLIADLKYDCPEVIASIFVNMLSRSTFEKKDSWNKVFERFLTSSEAQQVWDKFII